MIKQKSVSVVIPMFNEMECIAYTIKELSDFFSLLNLDYEIIVVDDGSTDGSLEKVRGLCKSYSSLKAITLYKNIGIGRALRAGYDSARNEVIIYTDADLPVDKESFRDVLDLLYRNNIDIVVGRRIGGRESSLRYVYTLVYNTIMRQMFKTDLRDINCPMKVFRRSVIENVKLKSDGPFIDAELLIKAKNKGFRIFETEVSCTRQRNRVSKFASPKKIISTLFKIVLELTDLYPELL